MYNANLNLLKKISARLVGLGSLFVPKLYGNKSYVGAIGWQLEKLQRDIPHKLETALLLNPEQIKAYGSFNFAVTGFYGVGKTTMLEVAIDKIIDKPYEFPNVKIVFATWNESRELKKIITKKFEKIKAENEINLQRQVSLEVFTLQEICNEYHVKPTQPAHLSWLSSFFFLDRNKVDVLNDLCKKLKGKLKHFIMNDFDSLCNHIKNNSR